MELTSHYLDNFWTMPIKFTPHRGEIRITTHVKDSCLIVAFQDSGAGMTPEIQKHIFDKFYQGDTSHKKKGNGLGLPLVHKIVALYSGSIQVESQPDLGSTFTVSLPF